MTFQDILGNFALILFILMIGTGVVWFLDVLYLKKPVSYTHLTLPTNREV